MTPPNEKGCGDVEKELEYVATYASPERRTELLRFLKNVFHEALTQQKREIQNNIGNLRQWLNEDRIKDPKNLVSNEDISHWLFPKP